MTFDRRQAFAIAYQWKNYHFSCSYSYTTQFCCCFSLTDKCANVYICRKPVFFLQVSRDLLMRLQVAVALLTSSDSDCLCEIALKAFSGQRVKTFNLINFIALIITKLLLDLFRAQWHHRVHHLEYHQPARTKFT